MKKNIPLLTINSDPRNISFNTQDFINTSNLDILSPIDLYWKNVKEINKLLSQVGENKSIGMLMLLGYVSAVESYFRQLFCRIICINPTSMKSSVRQKILYGAALSAKDSPEQLADALLEGCSFASNDNIVDTMKTFLGVKGIKGKKIITEEIATLLKGFEDICQLRHCAVHRFGLLGVNNAIKLGFEEHLNNIGNPLKLNDVNLELICGICINLVKAFNNHLYNKLLEQTVENNEISWKWNFRKDKKRFNEYYSLFYSKNFSREDKYILKNSYNNFRDKYND